MNSLKNILNKKRFSIGILLTFVFITIINMPIITIISKVNFSQDSNWDHFKEYLLQDAVRNTLVLIISTIFISGIIGVLLASVISLLDFPFKRFFEWALYIPIAIPPYIAAYVYAGMFSYTGIFQRIFRGLDMSLSPKWFDIMNLKGAVFIYSITLYPYVYGAVKAFIENHSGSFIDTARTLGYKPTKLFLKVILPLIRIPLIGGIMLTMMEVISDYGVVKYFNIQTVSSIIFKSWFGMGETGVAIRLSFYVMIGIIALQTLEEILRGRKKYNINGSRGKLVTPIKLKGKKGYILSFILLLFMSVAFIVPVGQMIIWALMAFERVSIPDINKIILNTLFYSTLATLSILLLNIWISHSRRWLSKNTGTFMSKIIQLGYSMPGAIIAVGTITFFVSLDGMLYPLYQYLGLSSKKLVLSSSIIMLIFAFIVRYMAVGFNNVNSAFAKVGVKYNDAARTLGMGKTKAMIKIELPILKNSLIAGFLLTFIDIIKELPLTLLLRPFNYNTLASRAYEYANDERIHEASVPALIIIALSIFALSVFVKINARKGEVLKNEIRNKKS